MTGGTQFELQGPDENGHVWICSPEGRDVWCHNLGHFTDAAEAMAQWLGSIDYDEIEARR
jgi:hypothetical protein